MNKRVGQLMKDGVEAFASCPVRRGVAQFLQVLFIQRIIIFWRQSSLQIDYLS